MGGLFHTDELPAYGITEEEVHELRDLCGAEDVDAVIIVAGEKEAVLDALRAVLERAKDALKGVPSETRASLPDGTTHFSRPRPGAARMYPETDVPPVAIDPLRLQRIREMLPPNPDVKLNQLIRDYDLNETLASQVLSSDYVELFERAAKDTNIAPSFLAATLVETMKSLSRQGVEVSELAEATIFEVFKIVDSGRAAKEAVPDILSWLAKNRKTPNEAIKALGLENIPKETLEVMIARVVEENRKLIEERGTSAMGPLMGTLMRELRGKVDARTLSELLSKKIESILKQNTQSKG